MPHTVRPYDHVLKKRGHHTVHTLDRSLSRCSSGSGAIGQKICSEPRSDCERFPVFNKIFVDIVSSQIDRFRSRRAHVENKTRQHFIFLDTRVYTYRQSEVYKFYVKFAYFKPLTFSKKYVLIWFLLYSIEDLSVHRECQVGSIYPKIFDC